MQLSGVWVVPTCDEPANVPTLRMRAGSTTTFGFDFGNLPELDGADLVSASMSSTPSVPTALGIADPLDFTTFPYRVMATFSGGSPGIKYTVVCTAAVAGGAAVTATATLEVL